MVELARPSASERSPRLPTLEGYQELLWANIVVIVVATIAGAALGFIAQRQVPVSWSSSASVELPDVPTWVDVDPADPIPDRTTIDTTAQLVFTQPVFRAVSRATDIPPVRIRDRLSVSAYPLSRVLIVTFRGDTPEQAEAGALAAGEALAAERKAALAGSDVRKAQALRSELNNLYNSTDHPFSDIGQQLRAQILQLQEVLDVNDAGAKVVEVSDARRVNTHPELQVITGAVLGLLAGIAYAWWRPRPQRGTAPVNARAASTARRGRRTGRRSLPAGARLQRGR